jgi:hypothetical protein
VLQDIVKVTSTSVFEILEAGRHSSFMECFAALESNVANILTEVFSERAAGFDLDLGQRILIMAVKYLELWLGNYHIGNPPEVGRVFLILEKCLRSLRLLSLISQANLVANPSPSSHGQPNPVSSPRLSVERAHSAFREMLTTGKSPQLVVAVQNRMGLTLFRSSLRQYHRVRKNFNVISPQGFSDFVLGLCDCLSTDIELFSPVLAEFQVHPYPESISSLSICWLFSRDLQSVSCNSMLPEDFLLVAAPAIVRFKTSAHRLSSIRGCGTQVLAEVLPSLDTLFLVLILDCFPYTS